MCGWMRNTQAVTAKVGKRAPDMRLLTIPEVRALRPEAATVRCRVFWTFRVVAGVGQRRHPWV